MESESGISNAKRTDSGYSNSCSNSNSQRSASSKSRLSGSNSSRSSGYCGPTSTVDGSVDNGLQTSNKHKDKKHKKKKLKSLNLNATSTSIVASSVCTISIENSTSTQHKDDNAIGLELLSADTLPVPLTTNHLLEKSSGTSSIANNEPLVSPLLEVLTSRSNDRVEETKSVELENNTDMENDSPVRENTETTPCQPEDGFCCAISIYDGVVLYTTPNLTNVLGFPKDMWIGRSFIDFVHPKDKETFTSQITSNIAIPLVDALGKIKDVKSSLYVCLRRYRGLKSTGFGVVEKAVAYQAFHLTVTFRRVTDIDTAAKDGSNTGIFLIVAAIPIYSSYKVPNETGNLAKFGMRHTAACILSHVDDDVATNFGFMPQDMLGKSVFDFYHPEDLPFLKEVYQSVMSNCQIAGSVYRSKPYRFAVQNGGFAMIETEWSCFINPWSRRLELIIGLHKVLEGPKNPDVFEIPPGDEYKYVSDEVIEESKIVREQIRVMLNTELLRPSEVAKLEVSKRCKDLATFMETIMSDISKSSIKLSLPQEPALTFSERDSVMLGEISPHHDYYDRESSSETPPSYTQLNYNENIHRFFQSKPMTTQSDATTEGPSVLQSTTTAQVGKNSADVQVCKEKCLSPLQNSGASGSGSAGNLSSSSNLNMESGTTSATNTSNGSYKPPHLTEALLHRHNEDMEKRMRHRHKQQRSSSRADKEKNWNHKIVTNIGVNSAHGVKRSVSHSWEGDKVYKHKNQLRKNDDLNLEKCVNDPNCKNATTVDICTNDNGYTPAATNNVNLWPPFSVAMTPISNTQPYTVSPLPQGVNNCPGGMFPVYYFPTQQGPTPARFNNEPTQSHFQVQYLPSMMYNNCSSVFPASPVFCSPVAMMPHPVPQQQIAAITSDNKKEEFMIKASIPTEHKHQMDRSPSQATSVKAEPGSAIGPVFSISCINGKTENALPKVEERNACQDNSAIDDESCYSSFYSSFLKTDTGSGSNDDTNGTESRNKNIENGRYQKPRLHTIRKCDPPWLESVSVTPELIYRYQVDVKDIHEILESDLNSLKEINQPMLVNEQLDQLYIEMELEGLSTKLTLEDGITSSCSSGDEHRLDTTKLRKKRRSYSSLMMIYEENAPFPPSHQVS